MKRSIHTLCALGMLSGIGLPSQAETIELPLTQWTFTSKGNFTGHLDRRNLYQILHPREPAAASDFGRIETQVTVPEGATPPYSLQFYVSDNVYGEGHGERAVVDLRVGHRFKEILVDGKTVWSQDIAVNLPLVDPEVFLVDVTEHVRPGQPFTLALQLRQQVDSSTRMPEDRIRLGMYAGTTREYTPHPYEEYATRSYWGEPTLHVGPRPEPSDIACRWEPEPQVADTPARRVPAAVRERAELRVEHPELLTAQWPVTQGLPLPMGAVNDTGHIALSDSAGQSIAAGFSPMSRWPDGSLRWVLADFALPAGNRAAWHLEWGTQVRSPAGAPAYPIRTSDALAMGNGLIRIECLRDDANAPRDLRIGRVRGGAMIEGFQPYMSFKDKSLDARWTEGRWLSRSPHRAELQLTGELAADDGDRYGTCRLRVSIFAGSSLVRVLVTIVNERTEAVPEDEPDHETIRRTRGLVGDIRALTATVTSYGLKTHIPGAAPATTEEGWLEVDAQAGRVHAVLRHFKNIWPVGMQAEAGLIDFQLFQPGDARMPTYGTYAGEAMTHEIWFELANGGTDGQSAAALAQLVETPPRLDVSAMIRDSDVWGTLPRLDRETHAAEYTVMVEGHLDRWYSNMYQGIRRFGGYPGVNFYWNRLHSMYVLYAMTGERKWYDRAERSARHNMYLCTLNWCPDGSMLGAKVKGLDKFLGIGIIHQVPHPYFDHWNMTGDPDGLWLGRANSDFILNHPTMRRQTEGRAARAQGWPLMAMVRAWQETGDEGYLEHARHIVAVAIQHMEARRGAYLQHHGSSSHLGIVPFMAGILGTGLRQYHYWTGDRQAAVALIQNAESMFAEMHDPPYSKTQPFIDYYYSPNPYLCGQDGKALIAHLNPNIASAQAYAAWLMDDSGMADIAWRTWQAYMKVEGWKSNSYDYLYDFPAVLYWLQKAPVPDRTLVPDELSAVEEAVNAMPPAELDLADAVLKVEAESFTGQGGGEIVMYQPEGVSGKAITYWHRDIGHWLEWTFDVPETGRYHLFARYATGSHNTARELRLNGEIPHDAYRSIAFPWTGGWSGSVSVWRYLQLGPRLELSAGRHVVRMTNLRDGLGVDYFVLKPAP